MKLFLDIDVALVGPAGMPHHARRGDWLPGVGMGAAAEDGDDGQSLCEVLRNLEGLSMGVPPLPVREIPSHMQQHIVGVPKRLLVPLRRIARVLLTFHEQ